MSQEHYDRLMLAHKLKLAVAPVLLVLALSQVQLIYSNLREDAMLLCYCIKRLMKPTDQTATGDQPNANEAAASV